MFAVKTCSRFAALTALVCALALALAGCGKKDDPPKAEGEAKGEKETPEPKPVPKPAPAPEPAKQQESLKDTKPDAVLTASEWDNEQRQDRSVVATKYAGKVVEVSGFVESIFDRGPDDAGVVLRGGKQYGEGMIGFALDGQNLATKLLPSQTVTIRVRGPQHPSYLNSKRVVWQIVEIKGKVTTYKAEQFARELEAANDTAVRDKFVNQHFIVEGTVAAVESDKDATRVFLDAGKDKFVVCRFILGRLTDVPLSPKQKDSLKEGQAVKVHGRYSGGFGGLNSCILLQPAP